MKTYPLITEKDAAGEHRSQIKADNGNITYASTEGYKNKKDCEDADRLNMYSLMAHFGVEAKEK
jgi:uncharacterized protein YegP (UPF0339 family)